MLIDRHRVATVLELSRLAGSSEAERVASQSGLEALLVTLYAASTPTARARFTDAMAQLPVADKPWGALLRPSTNQLALGPTLPPVAHLVLGQRDDDPDAAEDGNRLPDRDQKSSEPWLPLYAALDRWDASIIQSYIGPMGWQAPLVRLAPLDEGLAPEYQPARPVFRQVTASTTSPPPAVAPAAPASATSVPPAPHAALPIAVGLGAAALGGTLVFVFTRSPEVTP